MQRILLSFCLFSDLTNRT